MNKKRIYFVRHGESKLNAIHVRQGAEGGLSESGRVQAMATSHRMEKLPVDVVLVSPYERTLETARIINEKMGKPIESIGLLMERRNPTEIVGKKSDDPEVKKIIDVIDQSFHPNGLRYSDEENFDDLKERARLLLEHLECRQEKNILCVSHKIFLTMVISYMVSREKLTSEEFVKRYFFNNMDNAAITVCEFDPSNIKSETHGWEIISWNDNPYVQESLFE